MTGIFGSFTIKMKHLRTDCVFHDVNLDFGYYISVHGGGGGAYDHEVSFFPIDILLMVMA